MTDATDSKAEQENENMDDVCPVCGEPIKVERMWGLGDDLRSQLETGHMEGHEIYVVSCGCKGLEWSFSLGYALKMDDEMMKCIVEQHNNLARMMEAEE